MKYCAIFLWGTQTVGEILWHLLVGYSDSRGNTVPSSCGVLRQSGKYCVIFLFSFLFVVRNITTTVALSSTVYKSFFYEWYCYDIWLRKVYSTVYTKVLSDICLHTCTRKYIYLFYRLYGCWTKNPLCTRISYIENRMKIGSRQWSKIDFSKNIVLVVFLLYSELNRKRFMNFWHSTVFLQY